MKHLLWENETLNMGKGNTKYGNMKHLIWENERLIMGKRNTYYGKAKLHLPIYVCHN